MGLGRDIIVYGDRYDNRITLCITHYMDVEMYRLGGSPFISNHVCI